MFPATAMNRFGERGVETTSGTMLFSPFLDHELDVIQIGFQLVGAELRLPGREAEALARRIPIGLVQFGRGGFERPHAACPQVEERPDCRLVIARFAEGLEACQVVGTPRRAEGGAGGAIEAAPSAGRPPSAPIRGRNPP